MPTFRYKAYDSLGKAVAGDIEAAGLKDAVQQLKGTGLYPARVVEAGIEKAGRFALGRKVSSQTLAMTTRQLATLIASGTPLTEALGVLVENTENAKLKATLLKVRESVSQGSSFTKALEAHPDVFTPFYRGLASAGESSGTLDKTLPRLADHLETRARVLRDVKAALTYPVLMTLVGISVLAFLFIFVIPKITRIFEETQNRLPLITLILIKATETMRFAWPYALSALIASAFGLRKYLKTPNGRAASERLVFKAPFIGKLATAFYIANFTRTLGSLLGAGIHMLRALEITRQALDSRVFDRIIDTAVKDCTAGSSLSASLKKHSEIPPIVSHMASVGEKGGHLDEMLLRSAEAYENEFDSGVKKALNLMEPVLILAMGVAVGFIVLAILLPIFELNQTIR